MRRTAPSNTLAVRSGVATALKASAKEVQQTPRMGDAAAPPGAGPCYRLGCVGGKARQTLSCLSCGVESGLHHRAMSRAPAMTAEDITGLLHAWMEHRDGALDRLMEVLQDELRRLARIHMRGERRDHTLQPTALVNEVFVRLAHLQGIHWRDRIHFLSMVSRLMRRVLVDAARARDATKRGQSRVHVSLDHLRAPAEGAGQTVDLLTLDEALTRLAAIDDRKARVVEIRFFGGMTVEEAAEDLGVSPETIARDWRTAKIWLRREMARK